MLLASSILYRRYVPSIVPLSLAGLPLLFLSSLLLLSTSRGELDYHTPLLESSCSSFSCSVYTFENTLLASLGFEVHFFRGDQYRLTAFS